MIWPWIRPLLCRLGLHPWREMQLGSFRGERKRCAECLRWERP